MSNFRLISRMLNFAAALLVLCFVFDGAEAFASKGMMRASSSQSESRSYGRQDMMFDLSAHYVRDTKPDGGTDTAGRFSLGGMFNEWLGLDLQGLYQVRSKDYLVGADFRLVPTDWFFLKMGAGAFADKQTNEFKLTPLAGAGIMAHLSRDYYFVTETSYFSVNNRDNISFGVGLGANF